MNDKHIWLLIFTLVPLYFLMDQSNPVRAPITREWTLELAPQGVQFSIHRSWGGNNSYSSSTSHDFGDFRGLTRARMEAGGPAQFEMLRDAGTLACEGAFRNGGGGGTFVFSPSPDYVSALRGLGYNGIDANRLFELAVHNVSRAYIRELDEIGYHHLPFDELVHLRIHGVTAAFAATLKKFGYGTFPTGQLVELRIQRVTPEYMQGFRDMGYPRIAVDDLVLLRIHGVTTEFVNELRGMGYGRAGIDDLAQLRIHGVSADFVKDLQSLGYRNVPLEELVQLRIHGVTARNDSEAASRRLHQPLHGPACPVEDTRRCGIASLFCIHPAARFNTTTAPIAIAANPTAAAIFGAGSGAGGGTNVTPVSSVRAGSLA
jgi:hypothetical protein